MDDDHANGTVPHVIQVVVFCLSHRLSPCPTRKQAEEKTPRDLALTYFSKTGNIFI